MPLLGVAVLAALPTAGQSATPRHVPGVGNGLQPSTNAPDLVSVTVGNIPGNVTATYCFNKAIDSVGAASAYNIQTYDSSRVLAPTSVGKSTADNKCVVATFANGADIPQGTVGEVAAGAIRDVSNRPNIVASEPLTGGQTSQGAGATTGPDLTNVQVVATDQNAKKVVFTYDETLNPNPTNSDGSAASYSAADFGFYNGSNDFTAMTGTVSISGSSAIVNVGAQAVDNATVFAANPGAVEDLPQSLSFAPNPDALPTPSSPGTFGTLSARPSVSGATPDGSQGFLVAFNKPVQVSAGANTSFFAILDDGSAVASTSVAKGAGNNTAAVTFAKSINSDPTAVVRILAADGAVKSDDGSVNSAYSQFAVNSSVNTAGRTNGPDLLAATPDLTTNRVKYTFDELVGTTPAAGSLKAFAADGSQIDSTGGVVVDKNTVTANFPSTLSTAVAFGVGYRALADGLGFPNPNGSVSKDVEAAPAAPAPPATTPVPTTPPVATITKYTTKVRVSRKNARYKYAGRITTSGKGCKATRRVVLRVIGKGTKSYGSTTTRTDGTFTIKRTKRLKGKKVYAAVAERQGKKYPTVFCRYGRAPRISG